MHVDTALPYAAGGRAVLSTQTSAIGKVSAGHLILRSAALRPPSVSAVFARGTRPSRDSWIWTPVRVLRRSLAPGIDRFLIDEPSMVSAAYELPPRAMK